jgi:hypothetical protein
MSNKSRFIFLLILSSLLPSTTSASAILGKHSISTTNVFEILYGIVPVPDPPEDTLNNIILRSITTWHFGEGLNPAFHCPKEAPGNCTAGINYENTTSWEKTWSTSTSSTVSSKLSTKFEGIGSELESAFSVGFTVGTAISGSTSVSMNFSLPVSPGWTVDWVLDKEWVTYTGTYDWYDDTLLGGENHFDVPWSVTAQYKTTLFPVLVSEPAPFILLTMGFIPLLISAMTSQAKKGPGLIGL